MQNQHLTPHSIMHIKLTFGSREKKKTKTMERMALLSCFIQSEERNVQIISI